MARCRYQAYYYLPSTLAVADTALADGQPDSGGGVPADPANLVALRAMARRTSGGRAGRPAYPEQADTVRRLLRAPGKPLDQATRDFMEPRVGVDLSLVRVHTGSAAAESAKSLDARAYTVGRDIVFGAGEYSPHSSSGRHLLAHELIHTTQTGAGPSSGLTVSDPGDACEKQAETGADRIMRSVVPAESEHATTEPASRGGDQLRRAHKTEVQTFARSRVPGLDPSAPEAYYLACLLDHNEYSRREAASGLLISDELNQACSWIKTNTALDPARPSGVLMTRLNALMAASSPLAPRSDIQWGAATEWGAGTQVLVTLRAGGHPTGSDAGGDPEWMLQLQQRMDRAGKSLYVRGHLLNRHLGGPGLDYNMVPLTASGAWGANDANKAHSSSIEETVKDIAISLDNGGPDAVTGLRYGVQAIYGRAARAQTAQVAALAATFKGVVDQYQKLAAESVNPAMMVGIDAKSDADVQAAYLSLMAPSIAAPSPEAAYSSGGYDRAQVIGTLRMAMSGDFMRTTIAKLPPVLKDWFVAAVQAGSPILESVLNAVSPLDYKLLNISEVSHRMRENAALWQLEDTRVPIRLDLIATWTQFGNVENLTQSIDIRLPSSLNAAFSPRYDDD